MYGFMSRHLKLQLPEPILETAFTPLTRDELTVWNAQHSKPEGDQTGEPHEQSITRWMTEDAQRTLDAMVPTDAESLAAYRRVIGIAFNILLERRDHDAGTLHHENPTQKIDRGDHLVMTGILENTTHGENTPLLFVHPKKNWNQTVVVWLHGEGKSGLLDAKGEPIAAVQQLASAGFSVIGVDLLGQGEHADGAPLTQARMVTMYGGSKSWHHYAGYTFGYNPSLLAQRTHDAINVIRFARTDQHAAKHIVLMFATHGRRPCGCSRPRTIKWHGGSRDP